MESLAGRSAVVTGAAGFIGANLVRALRASGCKVTALVRPESHDWRLTQVGEGIRVVRASVTAMDQPATIAALGAADYVFHLAAAGVDQSHTSATELLAANVGGTIAALKYATSVSVRRFIYCGSCFCYGSATHASENAPVAPTSDYAASKAVAWDAVQAIAGRTGLDVVSLRPFTVYGPMESAHRLIPYTIERALAGEPIELTGGAQTRDFVYVDDVVQAFILAATSDDVSGDTFNVCTGVETSVRRAVEIIVALTGRAARPVFGARPYRQDELWHLSGNPTHARERLGWAASTSLEAGLALTIATREAAEQSVNTNFAVRT